MPSVVELSKFLSLADQVDHILLITCFQWCHGVVDSTCDTEYEQHGFHSQP